MRNARATSHDAGFTLLEMLVVVGIVALVIAVVAPLAGRTRSGMELRATAFAIATDMRDARTAAQRTNSEQAMVIDVGARQMWTGQAPRKALSRAFGMSLDVPHAERVSGSAGRMRFFPDGSASGGKVLLRQAGRVATVSVNWLNGDVQVAWNR